MALFSIYRVSKTPPYDLLNNSVKNEPIRILFGTKILKDFDSFAFVHLTYKM